MSVTRRYCIFGSFAYWRGSSKRRHSFTVELICRLVSGRRNIMADQLHLPGQVIRTRVISSQSCLSKYHRSSRETNGRYVHYSFQQGASFLNVFTSRFNDLKGGCLSTSMRPSQCVCFFFFCPDLESFQFSFYVI